MLMLQVRDIVYVWKYNGLTFDLAKITIKHYNTA